MRLICTNRLIAQDNMGLRGASRRVAVATEPDGAPAAGRLHRRIPSNRSSYEALTPICLSRALCRPKVGPKSALARSHLARPGPAQSKFLRAPRTTGAPTWFRSAFQDEHPSFESQVLLRGLLGGRSKLENKGGNLRVAHIQHC